MDLQRGAALERLHVEDHETRGRRERRHELAVGDLLDALELDLDRAAKLGGQRGGPLARECLVDAVELSRLILRHAVRLAKVVADARIAQECRRPGVRDLDLSAVDR